jgi:hypothetical protein
MLIVTDRTELDEQIEKVFKGVDEDIRRTKSGGRSRSSATRSRPTRSSSSAAPFRRSRPPSSRSAARRSWGPQRLVDYADKARVSVRSGVREMPVERPDLAHSAAVPQYELQPVLDLPVAVALER